MPSMDKPKCRGETKDDADTIDGLEISELDKAGNLQRQWIHRYKGGLTEVRCYPVPPRVSIH